MTKQHSVITTSSFFSQALRIYQILRHPFSSIGWRNWYCLTEGGSCTFVWLWTNTSCGSIWWGTLGITGGNISWWGTSHSVFSVFSASCISSEICCLFLLRTVPFSFWSATSLPETATTADEHGLAPGSLVLFYHQSELLFWSLLGVSCYTDRTVCFDT